MTRRLRNIGIVLLAHLERLDLFPHPLAREGPVRILCEIPFSLSRMKKDDVLLDMVAEEISTWMREHGTDCRAIAIPMPQYPLHCTVVQVEGVYAQLTLVQERDLVRVMLGFL